MQFIFCSGKEDTMMNTQLNQSNNSNEQRTTIEIVYNSTSSNVLHSTISKLAEVTNLPIKIICREKDKYLIRQQINEIQCPNGIFIDGDIASVAPSIIVTFHS